MNYKKNIKSGHVQHARKVRSYEWGTVLPLPLPFIKSVTWDKLLSCNWSVNLTLAGTRWAWFAHHQSPAPSKIAVQQIRKIFVEWWMNLFPHLHHEDNYNYFIRFWSMFQHYLPPRSTSGAFQMGLKTFLYASKAPLTSSLSHCVVTSVSLTVSTIYCCVYHTQQSTHHL